MEIVILLIGAAIQALMMVGSREYDKKDRFIVIGIITLIGFIVGRI